MADNTLRIGIYADTKGLNAGLTKAQTRLKDFGSKLSGVGRKLSLGLTAPLAIAGGAAIKMASDFEESVNKVDVAFKDASGEVKQFAKTTLSQFGIAQGTALDMAALFGDMSTSMGLTTKEASKMSTSLVGLAGDMASFKNMDIRQVMTALNGVFTGETESLKRMGIIMTQVNLEQFAMDEGINKNIKTMTQAEKVQLRYSYVMSKTKNAQGDFSRTSEGAANQMRIFQETMKELGATFGATILPAFTKLVKGANGILQKFNNLDDSTKKTIMIVSGLVAAIGPLLIVLGTMSSGLGVISGVLMASIPIIGKVAGAFKILTIAMVANPVGIMATGVTILTASFIEYLHRLTPVVSRTKTFFNLVKSLGNPLKFAALQATDAALAIEEERKETEAAAIAKQKLIDSLKGVVPEMDKAINATDNLGKALRRVESVSAIKLKVKTGDFDYAKGEYAKGSVAENARAIQTDTIGGIEAPSGDEMGGALKGLIAIQNQAQKTKIAIQDLNVHQQKMADLGNFIGGELSSAFSQIGDSIVESMGFGEDAMGRFASSFMSSALDAVGAALSVAVSAAIAGAAEASLLAGPGAAILLPALIAGMVGLVKGSFSTDVPQFANGGIVSGPTMGLMGEYSGARSNPEVIAPLDKLKGMIGDRSQNVNVGGEFRIQGQDLVVALQRAEKNRSRIL
tara:strand:- start:1340 stop:3388 length:2049 start_codon:yes stop_codon:yes gene_type:complete